MELILNLLESLAGFKGHQNWAIGPQKFSWQSRLGPSYDRRPSWDKYKSEQWRPLQSVVSYTHGPDRIEETFEFAWAEPEELELFLSKQDFNAVVKDDKSDWYKLFADFLGSQQTNKDKKTK